MNEADDQAARPAEPPTHRDDIGAIVAASRAECGLEPTITDEEALDNFWALVAAALARKRTSDRDSA
jgi:hypothetical protein